jgi:hypothetical protein
VNLHSFSIPSSEGDITQQKLPGLYGQAVLSIAQQLLAQVGQPFFHGLHLGFQFAEVSFQFGNLLAFGLIATLEPTVSAAALAASALAIAAFAAFAVVMSMSFIAAHR